MKKIFTILSIIFIQQGFSQKNTLPLVCSNTCEITTAPEEDKLILKSPAPQSNFKIVIESFSESSEEFSELSFDLETKGTYSFKLAPALIIPDGYTLFIHDSKTGNTFDLQSIEPHSFSVNRPMTKQFTMQIRKCEPVALTLK